LLVILCQYCLLESLLQILELLELAGELHVLLDVIEAVLDGAVCHLQVLLRQPEPFDRLFAHFHQMVVFVREEDGLDDRFDQPLAHASL